MKTIDTETQEACARSDPGEGADALAEIEAHGSRLEDDHAKYNALVNETDYGFLIVEADATISWSNEAYRQRFHTGTMGRLSCNEAVCGKATTCEACPARRMFETGQAAHDEMTRLRVDHFQHLWVTAVPLRQPGQRTCRGILMLQELSDLKVIRRSEEALRTTEQRFRSIFEQAGAGMVSIRATGSFLQVNPTFCTMLGHTESALLRKRLTDVTHPDDRMELSQNLSEVRAGNRRVIEMELRFVRHDGTPIWCHITSVWQFDAQNKPTYSVILIQDISERKRAETELEQSRRRYETLVHSIDGIVWEADPRAFRFSFISKQAQRILGFPVERWLTQPRFWRNQIHPEDLERVVQSLAVAVSEKRGHEIEYRIVSADGRLVWVRDTVSLVVDMHRVAKLRGLMVDITERKQAEEALRVSEEQLRQSQKMEAIGRLAGGIAHDFNNLLTAITGYGSFMIRKLGDRHPLQREAREIAKAAERAADLTGQLLAFSRQQVLQPKVVNLEDIVADMEMMLRRVIGEHIHLITRLDEAGGSVKADPGQIHQVLLNLVVNARDAMVEGGELIVATGDVELDEVSAAAIAGIGPGSYKTLIVRDSGSGIDRETMTRLFEPFFTTKEQGKGTGLGLSTVYGIVKQSGGHVAVESALGRGTTFTIYLPRIEDAPGRASIKEAHPDMATGTETILLVEDDDPVRELAREILEMNGYSVYEASNGVEALHYFEERPDRIDLLVTDLVMPRMGGRDLAERVAQKIPNLKVLYLSGYTDSVIMQQGMLDPGCFFLQKPFTPAALSGKVREALDMPESD